MSIFDNLYLCINFVLELFQSPFMFSLLRFSLLLKLELFLTLPFSKSGLLLTFFAWERCLMALSRLKMPLKTLLFDDVLAR